MSRFLLDFSYEVTKGDLFSSLDVPDGSDLLPAKLGIPPELRARYARMVESGQLGKNAIV